MEKQEAVIKVTDVMDKCITKLNELREIITPQDQEAQLAEENVHMRLLLQGWYEEQLDSCCDWTENPDCRFTGDGSCSGCTDGENKEIVTRFRETRKLLGLDSEPTPK